MNGRKSKFTKRDVDILARDINSWWGKSFVFIKKTRIKTWKGVFILAFTSGVMAATIWLVSLDIQSSSDAALGATLTVYTDDTDVTLESGKDQVEVRVLLNSHSNDVVAVKAILNYDPSSFEFQSYNTANTVFSSNNTCVYENKPCQIVSHDAENGKIFITLAKPSPGVTTTSGIIGQVFFKALKITTPSAPNFTLSYSAAGGYDDSDVIVDDGNGLDILSEVVNAKVNVYSATCSTFEYSEWGACIDNVKKRTVTASFPAGCFGGTPDLEDPCIPDAPTCTEFTYSTWGACQSSNKQYRTVLTKLPANCEGGNPILEQACEYVPPTCTSFTYSPWGACVDGQQTRTVLTSSPAGCTGGNPVRTQTCDVTKPTCTGFTYTNWGACQQDGTQSRTMTGSTPAGCQGGNPILTQICQFQKEEEKGDGINSDGPHSERLKDDEKPRFTDLPRFLNKNRGDMVWWEAKDNHYIKYYTYNFNGKKVETRRKHFFIPTDTPSGLYMLRVKVYDRNGNSKSRLVTVRVK